jgi:DNA-binding NarL/FixJ family response regulator
MGSNIPKARAILENALATAVFKQSFQKAIREALALMKREQPAFKAPPRYPKLTDAQAVEALRLRASGWGVNDIARELDTNSGRVSEVINPKD